MPEPNDISPYAPRIMSIAINTEKIGALIGPGGKNIKRIIEDTECEVNVDDDGIVTVAGMNTDKCNEAIEMVKALTFEPEVGMEFDGTVTRMMTFGAFVEFVPGREGLVHISELEWNRVDKVEDADNGMFRFHFKDKYLPAEEIVNLSVKEGWGLYHINMDVTSLEETFVNLTQTS